MTTQTNSSRFFASSSPTKYSSGPSDEVEELLAQAQTVDRLDPRVESFITAKRNDFFTAFARQVNLIRSRSQAFQDCHVTVFDKVLLELTRNGAHLENAAAIHYYCEEFLAISINTSDTQKTSMLSSALVASLPKFPALTPPNTYQGPHSTRDASSESLVKDTARDHGFQHEPTLLSSLARDISPAMERLWAVYSQAKREFRADKGYNDKKQHDAAKFLRDTAENILQYIRDKAADQRLIDELETSFKVAEEAVAVLHGGKKRKWDDPAADPNTEWTFPARKAPGRRDTERTHRRIPHNRGAREEPFRGDFPGHTQALTQHQRSTGSRNNEYERRNAMTELFPEEREPKRKKKNQTPQVQPGRGHSDIPFGYSRAVDSYQPGR